MGSISTSTSNRVRASQHQHQLVCTRTHHIGALILVVTTFFVTRILDRQFLPCIRPSQDLLHRTSHGQDEGGGDLPWPRHGYGDYLHLKIYVYDDHEIDGLKALMYGRDGTISPKACLKGQWGTQVFIYLFNTLNFMIGMNYLLLLLSISLNSFVFFIHSEFTMKLC